MPEPQLAASAEPASGPAPEPGFAALAALSRHGVLLAAPDGTVAWSSEPARVALGDGGSAALREAWPGLLAQRPDGAPARAALSIGDGAGGVRRLRVEVHRVGNDATPYLVLLESLDGDAVAQLRLANQALANSYLASALLHEINAPLNNIKLTLALCDASLARSAVDAMPAELRERFARYFKVVGEETSRLGRLLEELRRMSATSREAQEPFDLRELAGELARLMRHEATIRQIRLAVQPAGEALPTRADRRLLLLALLGLVIHLVEQTAPAGVVSVAFERGGPGEARVAIESTAAGSPDATRAALVNVAGAPRREDIPLVAARAQVEALQGAMHLVERDGRFGFDVRLPLGA